MVKVALFFCVVQAGLPLIASAGCVPDVPYDEKIGASGFGDVYLPEDVGSGSDVLLLIHGGGWTSLDRHSMDGVAEFFARELGFVVYNIDYRTAEKANRWPACGDDCITAARFVLAGGLSGARSPRPDRIWICGASAGGHLALWTLTHLPPEKVAGVISISSIGDPAPFLEKHEDIRLRLLPADIPVEVLDPRPLVQPGMAPVLSTHVAEDEIVPIRSHRAFADAYRAAGNPVEFFSYSQNVREGLSGHCIWRPASRPHELIPEIERRIGRFVRDVRNELWRRFCCPPREAKPWCYWFWINGHADRATITADLESVKRLGFGGVLMFDSRGYWDDDDHVRNPKAEIDFMSAEWFDLVEFSVRECARLGLEFSMNASASGGWCSGFTNGCEYVVDILDGRAISNHMDRLVGPLLKRLPDLVGKTFTHVYSVSFEGDVKNGGTWKDVKEAFYRTMADWAHGHGLKIFSEAGGPWVGGCTKAFTGARQLEMFDYNDFPQGEFWPKFPKGDLWADHANANLRPFLRGIVLAARRKGGRIVSCEAFTHMQKHWSVDPAFLKPLADQAFADGVNRLVWHTFTCSPDRFGVPGAEYFAGTHINRHVTWQREGTAFVNYLSRCQALLQAGEYVDDGQFENVERDYYGWGRFRKNPDAQFTWTHRSDGTNDWFFVAGENEGTVDFPATAPHVELWDTVEGTRVAAEAEPLPNGRTRVRLNLPWGGSAFIMFLRNARLFPAKREPSVARTVSVKGPWRVSFAYHPGISAPPPPAIRIDDLIEWTSDDRLKFFSGTATYTTSFCFPQDVMTASCRISVGALPSGVAHVYLNGRDCGCVWCAPWSVDVSEAIRPGENVLEIRYVNNWRNRLIGDCFLSPSNRVTASTIQYRRGNDSYWKDGVLRRRRECTGYSTQDPLQPSGLLGPVAVLSSDE